MKLINLISLNELEFDTHQAFDNYTQAHKLRPDTKVKVAGKVTTAGQAAKDAVAVKGTPVFGATPPAPKKDRGMVGNFIHSLFGHDNEDKPFERIDLDPKHPINNAYVYSPKGGSSVKVSTALANQSKYRDMLPAIKKMIEADPNGEKAAAKNKKAKEVAKKAAAEAKAKIQWRKDNPEEAKKQDEKERAERQEWLKKHASRSSFSSGASDDDIIRNYASNALSSYYSSGGSDSGGSSFSGFGGGSSGGAGASGDW